MIRPHSCVRSFIVPVTFFAIAGASGSGKTLFAKNLLDKFTTYFPNQVAILHEDAYYKDQSHLDFATREGQNYDHPGAFDHALLMAHIKSLKAGNAVKTPVYDYSLHTRSHQTETVSPAKVFLIEGIMLLQNPELRALFDYKIFINTPLDICFGRRLQRDIQERGRSVDSVIQQYHSTVRPMFFAHVEPSREWADIIVPQGGMNRPALELVQSRIERLLG